MQQKNSIWRFIIENFASGKQVTFLLVLQSHGSSPGRQGFKMAICEDGRTFGSIGGGIMEHKFVTLARRIMIDNINFKPVHRQVHNKDSERDQSGMICSGEQVIFIHRVTENDIAIFQKIADMAVNDNSTLRVSNDGFTFENVRPSQHYSFTINEDNEFLYNEMTGYKNRLLIIGGGHCALALSALMSTMDFYITVIDERNSLQTIHENVCAHEIKTVNGYEELQSINNFKDAYIVIMTAGYRTDLLALKALMNQPAKYIGVLGSKKKMAALLSEKDFTELPEAQKQIIHSPIGIQIKSETPEEIAVSIAAEIIAVKNKVE